MSGQNHTEEDAAFLTRVESMRRFHAPLISDTMDRLGMKSGVMHHAIQQVFPDATGVVCGVAFPCRVVPTKQYVEIDTLLEMIDNIPDGAMVVVSADADTGAALWGGLMSARAAARGAVGAVVNGGVRDLAQIAAAGFPVFGAYRCVKDIRTRGAMVSYNVPVFTGGVTIVPGDVVFGDANGVVVIPRERFDRVHDELDAAWQEESKTQQGLIEGVAAQSLFARYGRF